MANPTSTPKGKDGNWTNPTTMDKAKDVASQTMDKARDLASHAADSARDAASSVGNMARDAASSAGNMARDAASSAGNMASNAASNVGKKAEDLTAGAGSSMRSLADTISQKGPQEGMLGDATKTVANTLREGGKYLEETGLSGISDDVTELIRRNPVPALLVGIGLGFFIGRMLRS